MARSYNGLLRWIVYPIIGVRFPVESPNEDYIMKHEQAWKWIMSIIFLIAAITLSSNFSLSRYGYPLFALGHILGILIFRKYKDHAMFWHNVVFLSIDFWGIYRWFL